jgi:hypothetical protein
MDNQEKYRHEGVSYLIHNQRIFKTENKKPVDNEGCLYIEINSDLKGGEIYFI